MSDDPWKTHIRYLEDEVAKMGERVDKLEAMLPGLESEEKKREVRELIRRLRGEVSDQRKYLALVKQK